MTSVARLDSQLQALPQEAYTPMVEVLRLLETAVMTISDRTTTEFMIRFGSTQVRSRTITANPA